MCGWIFISKPAERLHAPRWAGSREWRETFNLLNALWMLSVAYKDACKGGRPFPVAAIWNDWLGSVVAQFFPQTGAVISRVANHAFQ
jgi:hypothetical protein